MEKQITLSLDEYNTLKAENKRMHEILDSKEQVVGIRSVRKAAGIGYFTDTWNVLKQNDLIGPMAVRIHELESREIDSFFEIKNLKHKIECMEVLNKKKWYQIF